MKIVTIIIAILMTLLLIFYLLFQIFILNINIFFLTANLNRYERIDDIVIETEEEVVREETTTRQSDKRNNTYKVTAYCPCIQCCGKTDGITASGVKATPNHTIATSSEFPFGTKLKIGDIVYTVEDRGGAIQGNRIDIYFNTHQEALNYGVQYHNIEIIK